MKVLLIFNKVTKAYIGSTYGEKVFSSDHKLNEEHFIFKQVVMNSDQEWEGDLDTGSIKPVSQLTPIISESELDQDCRDKIFRRYQYYHQLNIIHKIIDKLVASGAVDLAEDDLAEFSEMKEYLTTIRSNNDKFKTAYNEDHTYKYLDKAAERQMVNDQMEGGLHEIIGRPSREAQFN